MTDPTKPHDAPPSADLTWDAGPLPCGELILELQIWIRALPAGTVIQLRTEDAGAPTDIPAWCRLTDNPLIHTAPPTYWIRRGAPTS